MYNKTFWTLVNEKKMTKDEATSYLLVKGGKITITVNPRPVYMGDYSVSVVIARIRDNWFIAIVLIGILAPETFSGSYYIIRNLLKYHS